MAKALNFKTQSLSGFTVKSNTTTDDTAIVVDIPVNKINEVKQDFIIHDDTVSIIAESIMRDGQLDPCIVTPSKDGNTYDLLSGRHRRRAVIEAGLSTVKCIIKNNLTEQEKELIILNTNLNRNNDYLPSELAFAYKRKFELLKDNTDGSAMEVIAEENKISRKKVQRYISLTKLIKPLLNRVDNGSIPFIAGVQLSKLSDIAQAKVFEYLINHTECKITTNNVADVRLNYDNLDVVFYPEEQVIEEQYFEPDNSAISYTETVEKELTPTEKEKSSTSTEEPIEEKTPISTPKVDVPIPPTSDEVIKVDNLSTLNDEEDAINNFVESLTAKKTKNGISTIKEFSATAKELNIEIGGISFLCIFGKHINGAYLAIPNFGVATEMALDDYDYNLKQLLNARMDGFNVDEVMDYEQYIAQELARIVTKELNNM